MKARMLANAGKTPNPETYKSMAQNLDMPVSLFLSTDGKTLTRNDVAAKGHVIFTKQ